METTGRDVGAAIARARAAQSMKQAELAKKCNIRPMDLQKIEQGTSSDKAAAQTVARVLGLKLPKAPRSKNQNKNA